MNFTLYLVKAKISIYFLILVGKIAKERDIEITYYIIDLLGSLRLFKVDLNRFKSPKVHIYMAYKCYQFFIIF